MANVFMSYVRENRTTVARLAEALEAFDIRVWLDHTQLQAGVRWQTAIREAIANGDFFIACFSREYQDRLRTYMNEELVLAIDEMRKRSTHRAWFIPVLLNECEVPDRDIGAGETLRSFQWINLHEDWNDGIRRILAVAAPSSAKLYELQRQLESHSARERIRAADGLAAMGDQARRAVPALTRLLDDENETVRAAAAAALGAIGDAVDETIAGLQRVMRDGEFYESKHAARALAKLGHRAVPALLEARTYPGYGVAQHAESALSEVQDPAAISDLLREARNGSLAAVEALGRLGRAAGEAIPILAKMIDDPSATPHIVLALSDEDSQVRAHAIDALDWTRFPDALVTLGKLLHDPDMVVRMHAAKGLGGVADSKAVLLLIDALEDDPNVVRVAAEALGSLRDPAAVPALVQKLSHEKEWVRESVLEALVEIGSPEALRAVREVRTAHARREE